MKARIPLEHRILLGDATAHPGKLASCFGRVSFAVLVALLLRLAVMPFLLPDQLNVARDHWSFGYEAGRLARSIATGHGFSSPLFGETGPSAWMAPGYPALMALVFRFLGVYTQAAAIVLLVINAIASSLTCLPVSAIARQAFGRRAALWASWGWAICPYGIYFSMERMWETTLATLLLTTLFYLSIRDNTQRSWPFWSLYGALWALAALTSPTLCTVFPLLAGYALLRLRAYGRPYLRYCCLVGLVIVIGITPWLARNYNCFHRFLPMRDGFGMSLRLGTRGPHAHHWAQYELGPWHTPSEWVEFQTLGELGYMDHKQTQAIAAIRSDPQYFAVSCARRALFIWTGFWSFNSQYLKEEPLDLPNIPLCTGLTLCALIGLIRLRRLNAPLAALLAATLMVFPLIYYTTSPEDYYRRPLDPLLVVLAGYTLSLRKQKQLAKHVAEEITIETMLSPIPSEVEQEPALE